MARHPPSPPEHVEHPHAKLYGEVSYRFLGMANRIEENGIPKRGSTDWLPIGDLLGCAIGSWGGRRPSLGGYVTGTRATDGATPAGGVHVDYPLCHPLNVKNLPDPLRRKLKARARRQRRSVAQGPFTSCPRRWRTLTPGPF